MKKIISIFSLFVLISVFSFGLSFGKASAQNNVGSLRSVVTPSFSFNKDLRFGDIDPDVMELQKVLNADPETVVAVSDTGSRGHENTTFGASTKAAVIKFQNKYSDTVLAPAGLTTGSGFVGKLTRTRLNLLIGVIDTFDSFGSPASRVVSNVAPTPTPTPTPTPVAPSTSQMSTCQLVNVLINIEAIPADKANSARLVTNCSTSNPNDYGSNGATVINNYYYNNKPGTSNSGTDSSNTNNSGTPSTQTPINVICTANPYSVALNTPTRWTALAVGGTGSYTYSWSGDGGLNSTNSSFSKSYSSNGYKNALVRVTSGSEVATANCQSFVGDLSMATTSDTAISLDGTSTCNGGGPNATSSDSSSSFTGLPFAGKVVTAVKCITSYYPYREDSSIRQVVITPCSGSTGQSTGFLIMPVADVPASNKTILGRAMPAVSMCLNPPGVPLGKPSDFRIGDSCSSSSSSSSSSSTSSSTDSSTNSSTNFF